MIPFVAFLRRVGEIYTTNALESVHAQLRKICYLPVIERKTSLISLISL